jgi:thiol-disulfide isomerase/thioredoxin
MKELIFFFSDWDPNSKKMIPIVESFTKDNQHVNVSWVNISADASTTNYYFEKYNIQGIPAFIGIDNGLVIDGVVGTTSKFVLESIVNA